MRPRAPPEVFDVTPILIGPLEPSWMKYTSLTAKH